MVLKKLESTHRVGAAATDALRGRGKRGSLAVVGFSVVILLAPALRGATIRIENASPNEFRYSLRRQNAEWSGETLELGPGQHHIFQDSEPLVVSYWTDKARFATLESGRTYRIDDTRSGELRPVVTVLRPRTELGGIENQRGEPSVAEMPKPPADEPGTPKLDQPPTAGQLRVVKILAVADSTYRMIIDNWEQRIGNAVQGASEYYESNFGIRFVVTATLPLDYKGLNDKPNERWKRLLKLSPGDADVLVAFIGFGDHYRSDDGPRYIGHLGQGMPFGQHAMVSGERFIHPNRDRAVLIHELAHLFGAFHVQNKESVMQRSYNDIPTQDIIQGELQMDAPLREVVMLARNVDFRRGVESLTPGTRSRLKSLCRQYRHPAERKSPDPVEMGYQYLSSRAEATKQAEAEPKERSLPTQHK